jgi:hypothetical protein
MTKYFINVTAGHIEYLFLLIEVDGHLRDEFSRSCDSSSTVAECKEINKQQYERIFGQLESGGDEFDGDWNRYEIFIREIIELTTD